MFPVSGTSCSKIGISNRNQKEQSLSWNHIRIPLTNNHPTNISSCHHSQKEALPHHQHTICNPNVPDEHIKMRFNSIPRPSRRSSALSTASASSTSSDLSIEVLESTLPLAPREDDFNMSEKDRAASLLARCRRAATEPWKSAKPLMAR